LAQHEVDLDRCDRMLTYGEGIFPRSHVLGGSVAQLVPVGSAKVERERRARRHVAGDGQHVRVLVLGESSSGNTLGASFALEDTERYRVEREVIDVLANSPRIRVTYRPFPIDPVETAVPAWIARDRPDVAVALAGPKDDWSLRRHFAVADVAVTALSSGTVWNEALAVDVPLVVYCDPRQTILADDFAADLDQACLWARTSADFIAAARRLADDPDAFLADLRARNAKSFLERYVLHRDDGRCVERALEALAAARASSGSPAREEAAQSIRSTDQVNAGRM
jgi:hypothetical protein